MVEGVGPLLVCRRSRVQILALRSHKVSKTLFALQTLQVKHLDSSAHTPAYAISYLGNYLKVSEIFNRNIFKRGQ
jgi:hypothetical protein